MISPEHVTPTRDLLHIVVPVYNEAANMPRLFEDLNRAGSRLDLDLEIVLVDDGSTDGTGEAAEAVRGDLQLVVLKHDVNRGPGYAFGTAFEYLAQRLGPTDLVVTMEGDNTSNAGLIEAMVRRIGEGHDAVFASPYMYGGGIANATPTRVILSHIANTFVKEFLGIHGLLTVSSFFRLYTAAALRRLQQCYGDRIIEREGFESMVELVMKMVYLGYSLSEVPMVLDSTRRVGRSKMNTTRTALGYFRLFGRKEQWRRGARRAV